MEKVQNVGTKSEIVPLLIEVSYYVISLVTTNLTLI